MIGRESDQSGIRGRRVKLDKIVSKRGAAIRPVGHVLPVVIHFEHRPRTIKGILLIGSGFEGAETDIYR